MTPRERAKTVTDEVGTATTGAELRDLIEQAITAAVEEAEARATAHLNAAQASFDRRERETSRRPSKRTDEMTPRERAEQLWETWKKATFVTSTRTIHAENYIRIAEQAITAAVDEEREACAKIADYWFGDCADQIRARSNASSGETK